MLYVNANSLVDEVEIGYDVEGLRLLEQVVLSGLGVSLDFVHSQFFTKAFSRLFVFDVPGKLRFEFSGDSVEIRGEREYLEVLWYNLKAISSGAHFHLDNYDDHPLLDQSCSAALVFSRF